MSETKAQGIDRTMAEFYADFGRMPKAPEIAEIMILPVAEVWAHLDALKAAASA